MAIEAIEGDGVLVREHLDGADGAFEVLYERYFPRLVRLCLRSTRCRPAAEDVAQETLVRALIHLDRFDTTRPLWPWLSTIASRLLAQRARDRKREMPVEDPAGAPDPGLLDLDPVEERPILLEALSNLPPRQRVAVALRYLEDWDHDRVARFMDLSESAFRQVLYRGRRKLREEYRRLTEGMAGLVLAPLTWLRRAKERAAAHGATGGASAASGIAFHVTTAVVALLVTTGVVVSSGSETADRTPEDRASAVRHERGESRVPGSPEGRPNAAPDAEGGSSGSEDPAAIPGKRGSQGREAVSDVADPNRNVHQPEDAEILSIAHSPAFDRDRTVLAAGVATCRIPQCPPVLFRSEDAGASWDRLAADGFRGTQVLLPPTFGRGDVRIFALGPLGLQVSEDGGGSFGPAAPVPSSPLGTGTAVISPAFNEGDPRIVLGGQALMQYRDDARTVGPAEPIPGRGPFHPAFSPGYAEDGVLLIGGVGFDEAQRGWVSTVFRCREALCSGTPLGPGESAQIRIAPDFSASGTMFAFRGTGLFASDDGGLSFSPVSLPSDEILLRDIAFTPGRGVLLATTPMKHAEASGGLFASPDNGATWTRVSGSLLADGVRELRASGDHVLAALGGAGIACSADGGLTWARRCAV